VEESYNRVKDDRDVVSEALRAFQYLDMAQRPPEKSQYGQDMIETMAALDYVRDVDRLFNL
jgi:hypothetical protein